MGEPTSGGARLIEHWWSHETRLGLGKGESSEYRRHGAVLNRLLKRVDGDEAVAKRVIDRFFQGSGPVMQEFGWTIGLFDKRLLGLLVAVRREEASAKIERERLRERAESARPMPPEVRASIKAMLDKMKP